MGHQKTHGDSQSLLRFLPIVATLFMIAAISAAAPSANAASLKVLEAKWGADTRIVDVTIIVQDLLDHGKTEFDANPGTLGDPASGTIKTLSVKVDINGVVTTRKYVEGITVRLDAARFQPDASPIKVIEAKWGEGTHLVDASQILQDSIDNGDTDFHVLTNALGDPESGADKTLSVTFYIRGANVDRKFHQFDTLNYADLLTDPMGLAALSAKINSFDSWKIDHGTWSAIDNGIKGIGNCGIRCSEILPPVVRLSFTVKPVEGIRTRMYFDGPDISLRSEGFSTNFAVYSKTAPGQVGPKIPYNNDDEIKVIVSIFDNHFEFHVNDQIVTGSCADHDGVRLRFQAGDRANPGTTEFTSFLAEPIDASQVAATATMPSNQLAAATENAPKLGRLQSSIQALYVREQGTGEMLGKSSELTLSAYPGPSAKQTPVQFTTQTGNEMHVVLDDVLRYMRTRYQNWGASRVELSFADKSTPKDGASVGAAIGTLLLSMIQGFDIDPDLAITGDVTASGKIRAVGGLAAKIRGASEAKCKIVAAPVDNYEQVVDAFVYEGAPLITNMQVIGIADLDEAAALARVDRADNLKEAIDAFADVQKVLQKNPKLITSKDVAQKLAHVLELEPNHFSAKLLLLTSQGKQPKKMSAAATEYYTNVAVQTMLPAVTNSDKTIQIHVGTPAEMQEGLKKIQKARWYANPQLLNYVVATQDFMQSVVDAQTGKVGDDYVRAKAQAVLDESAKLSADRDLMEKMLHEGI